jgi:hypothetical protein
MCRVLRGVYGAITCRGRNADRGVGTGWQIEAAHKKGTGSSKNGRDSNSQRLGVKVYGEQPVKAGGIIIRQRGYKVRPSLCLQVTAAWESSDTPLHPLQRLLGSFLVVPAWALLCQCRFQIS